jgi:hypothetical protein
MSSIVLGIVYEVTSDHFVTRWFGPPITLVSEHTVFMQFFHLHNF